MTHTFPALQVLNVLTGHLHTNMDDIYKFFNNVIEPGIMTHMLPRALKAIKPMLEIKFPALPHDGYHPDHSNEDVSFEFTRAEKDVFWKSYLDMPNPLEGKQVIAAII